MVELLHGGQRCQHDQEEPGEEWTEALQRAYPGGREVRTSWFARTDQGSVARGTIGVAAGYGSGSTVVQWVLVPPSQVVFAPGPDDLEATWNPTGVLVTWRGVSPDYLVEVAGPGGTGKTLTSDTEFQLTDLDGEALYRVLVRGIARDGSVSLPSEVVCRGQRANSVRATIDLPGRWYDVNGGASLREQRAESDRPDVVFDRYGVYVPGGGVARLGRGRDVLDAAIELPERGYLPSYGRLDNNDVFAVRVADGRHGKFMISAMDYKDPRSGMRVHLAFLPGGGRRFMARPTDVTSQFARGVMELSWNAAEGAERYLVTRDEDPAWRLDTKSTRVQVRGLARQRFHEFSVRAVDERGDESDPLVVEAHTFSDRYQLGRFELHATPRQGYSVTLAKTVARGNGEQPHEDLEVQIVSSAGGASYLAFVAPYGGGLATGLRFGEFPGDGWEGELGQEFGSDVRGGNSDVFLLKTRDGKLVSARIRSRVHPRIMIDYVLRR